MNTPDNTRRCTFEDDIEFEHPALTTFANCKFACLTFESLQCTAVEFEPDNPGLLDLTDDDTGRYVARPLGQFAHVHCEQKPSPAPQDTYTHKPAAYMNVHM
jgi:hypothetical protein